MPKPELTIQIVNYKTKAYLNPLIESIVKDLAQTELLYEILIIDNASGDDLSDVQSAWADHNLRTYESQSNGGFGAGHNQLFKHASGKYVLILNPDVLLIEPNTISRLMATLKSNQAAVAGPLLYCLKDGSKGPLTSQQVSLYELEPQEWDHGELKVRKIDGVGQFTPRIVLGEVAMVSGAFYLIEAAMFDKVGGFDENFFLYAEEDDLCLRLRRIGGKTVYDPSIHALHYGSVVASKKVHLAASQAYFIQKHGDLYAV